MTATAQRLHLVYGLSQMEEAPFERTGPDADDQQDEVNQDTVHATRFRFKSKSRRRAHDVDGERPRRSKRRKVDGDEQGEHHDKQDGQPGHHGRRHRRHRGRSDENSEPPNPSYEMDAETAFRESLFDAMADDEGAAFWEGVYGQPIHTYPKTKEAQEDDAANEGLRQMSDEEYTAYVRQQMWEKTHEHVIEERRRRAEAAERRRQGQKRSAQMESEKTAFDKKMEESLRRGEERRRDKAWRDGWNAYARGWARLLDESKGGAADGAKSRDLIPWPCRSGRAADVSKDEVEAFFEHAAWRDAASNDSLRALLKAERVRWHPDKMQQRFGANKIDADTLRAVVAVFQIVDAQFARL